MSNAALVVGGLVVAMNAAIAAADLVPARFVLANSAEVGVPRSWLPSLALLKGAGALGLLVGLLSAPVLGVVAAVCLSAFYVGAIVVHVRARVFHNVAFPATFLTGAIAAGALLVVGG